LLIIIFLTILLKFSILAIIEFKISLSYALFKNTNSLTKILNNFIKLLLLVLLKLFKLL